MGDTSKRESAQSYLDAFQALERTRALYFDARRNYRADRDRYERMQQDYLLCAARVAVIAKKIGIKPLGGFAPALVPPLGMRAS